MFFAGNWQKTPILGLKVNLSQNEAKNDPDSYFFNKFETGKILRKDLYLMETNIFGQTYEMEQIIQKTTFSSILATDSLNCAFLEL